jgi:hypothetical protein
MELVGRSVSGSILPVNKSERNETSDTRTELYLTVDTVPVS